MSQTGIHFGTTHRSRRDPFPDIISTAERLIHILPHRHDQPSRCFSRSHSV
uniref:Uncharacterized protein n=1 Tax=Anguilla anguilla TaxID=7936 RepID=A0A0E9SV60_ANGAN